MAIGYVPSVGTINSDAGALAVRWQQQASDMLAFSTGPAGALNAAALQALGFSVPDSTTMVAIIVQMGNFAGVYYGTQAQAPGFNYYSSFRALRGTTF